MELCRVCGQGLLLVCPVRAQCVVGRPVGAGGRGCCAASAALGAASTADGEPGPRLCAPRDQSDPAGGGLWLAQDAGRSGPAAAGGLWRRGRQGRGAAPDACFPGAARYARCDCPAAQGRVAPPAILVVPNPTTRPGGG